MTRIKLNQGGRPTLEELDIERFIMRITLTLYGGEDDDLIDWFESIPTRKRAISVKTALRQGGVSVDHVSEDVSEFISDDLLDDLLGAL